MKKYLALDFETFDLDAQNTLVSEVGAILFDENFREIAIVSSLCHDESDPPLSDEIIEITGITNEMLKAEGLPRKRVFESLLVLLEQADVVFIHNVPFDKTILEATCKRLELPLPLKEYVCTLTNFDWPKKFRCFKLGHLGFDHNIDLRGLQLHRAVSDCRVLIELLKLYNMEKILDYARLPWGIFKGDVTAPWHDGGVQSDLAKANGFSWEKVRVGYETLSFPKTWVKRMKLPGNLPELPFRVVRIQ